MNIYQILDSLKKIESTVSESKKLARRVRVVAGDHAGQTGTIRQIKHGAFKGAPKSYYIDLDNGGQADNLPASALRLVKDQTDVVEEATALEKWRKAADEREKKHADAEKEMKARHARGEEDMKGAIDRLEKHLAKDTQDLEEKHNFSFANPKQHPGDQWRGTDSGTPGEKLVGEENIGTHQRRATREGSRPPRGHEPVPRYKTIKNEQEKTQHIVSVTVSDPDSSAVTQRKELKQRRCKVTASDRETAIDTAIRYYRKQGYRVHDHHYVKPVTEAGANNPPQGSSPADAARQLTTAQQNLNKLKSAGVNLPIGVSQAAQSAIDTAKNPGAVAGQAMDADDKKTATALGQELSQAVAKGSPSQMGQLANILKQIEQGSQE